MDFKDSPEEAAFRDAARGWLDAQAPLLGPGEAAHAILEIEGTEKELAEARDWQQRKFDAGFACMGWPVEFGGRDLAPIFSVIWGQEEGRYRVAANPFIIGTKMAGPVIMQYGSGVQKQRFVSRIARGDDIWCQLFSEPAGGSDLAGVRTSAVRDGDGWVINGQKVWSTGAQYSQWAILLARSDASLPKHQGLTFFLLDMATPGIEVRPIRQMSGQSGFNEVFLSDVRISDDFRLGAEGEGWKVALSVLMNERAGFSGGLSPSLIVKLVELMRDVDTAERRELARLYVQLKALEGFGYRALTRLSQGGEPGVENSLIKLVSAPLQQRLASAMLDLKGTAGALDDPADRLWSDTYLSSPGLRIAGGTDEIMRNIIAERILGLPSDVRVDKDVAFRDIPSGRGD